MSISLPRRRRGKATEDQHVAKGNQQKCLHCCSTQLHVVRQQDRCGTLFGLQEPIQHGLRLLLIASHGGSRPLGAAVRVKPVCWLLPLPPTGDETGNQCVLANSSLALHSGANKVTI